MLILENKKERRETTNKSNALEKLPEGATFDKAMFSAIEPFLLKKGFNVTPAEAFTMLAIMVVRNYGVCNQQYFKAWAGMAISCREDGGRRLTMQQRWEQS
jgi:hypothetical protein